MTSRRVAAPASLTAAVQAGEARPVEEGSPAQATTDLITIDYPALYDAANAASLAGQQGYKWLVVADLGLLAAAAIISVGNQFFPDVLDGWDRVFAAALVAVALIAKLANRLRGFDEQWFDGRAVAETVKSATWRYAMHAPPFVSDDGADAAFIATLRDALEARPELMPHLYEIPADGEQLPRSIVEMRAMPLPARKSIFLAERLADQIKWYASKAAANARSASRWFWVGLAAQGGALIVAIALIQAPGAPDVVAAFTTVAAAVAAWTQFRRHDELSKSYSMAAQELGFLRSAVERAQTEEAFHSAVVSTEDAVSREHTMWMAKRG